MNNSFIKPYMQEMVGKLYCYAHDMNDDHLFLILGWEQRQKKFQMRDEWKNDVETIYTDEHIIVLNILENAISSFTKNVFMEYIANGKIIDVES